MSSHEIPATAVAWVESPFQLIGALEAHAAGLLGRWLEVVPRAETDPLAATVAEFRRFGLPDGVTVRRPAYRPPSGVPLLAVGDAFSGQVQRLLAAGMPGRVVLLDDGRATRRMLDALVQPGVPLLRPHVPAPVTRQLLARLALARLRAAMTRGRVELVTALDLPEPALGAAASAGLPVRWHRFGWLRSLPLAEEDLVDRPGTVVLGSSMVANGLVAAEPYLEWVCSIARTGATTYRAHRREDERTLGPLAAAGVDVRSGALPVEVGLRGLRPGQDVLTLPTTAASTLRMLAPTARIREFAVPQEWWLPSVPQVARRRLVPDESAGPAGAGVVLRAGAA